MHTDNLIIKEVFKILKTEIEQTGHSKFDKDFEMIKSVINGADVHKKRSSPECAKCLNDLLLESEPNDDQKEHIARTKFSDFDEKSPEEKSEIISNVSGYTQIKPVFAVRFRTWTDGLRAVLIAKPIIEACSVPLNPNFELVGGEMPWTLIEALYSAFRKITIEMDLVERATASVSGSIQSFLDIIEHTLDKKFPTTQT